MKKFIFLAIALLSKADPVKVPELNGFKDVEFTKIEGDQIRFSHKDGAGKMALNTLPADILEKVNKEVPKTDMVAKAKAEEDKKTEEILKKYQEDFSIKFYGKVFQIVKDGVLVRSFKSIRIGKTIIRDANLNPYREFAAAIKENPDTYEKVPIEKLVIRIVTKDDGLEPIFLHCDTTSMFDGKEVAFVVAFPAGTYTYESVSNVKKTVRAYSTDQSKSFNTLINSLKEPIGNPILPPLLGEK